MKNFEHPNPDANVVDDFFLNNPNYFTMSEKDEPPTKENSLYLTITQQWFDEIVSGRKTVEYREIKDTTLSRYFYVPKKEDEPWEINPHLSEDAPLDIFGYNNGIFSLVPKDYAYLRLGVGYNKDRDTAIIRLKGACSMPQRLPDGRIYRFNDEEIKGAATMTLDQYINATYNENGELCNWIIGYELGEIVEVNRKK